MKGTGALVVILALPLLGFAQGTQERRRDGAEPQPQDYTVELTFVGLGAAGG